MARPVSSPGAAAASTVKATVSAAHGQRVAGARHDIEYVTTHKRDAGFGRRRRHAPSLGGGRSSSPGGLFIDAEQSAAEAVVFHPTSQLAAAALAGSRQQRRAAGPPSPLLRPLASVKARSPSSPSSSPFFGLGGGGGGYGVGYGVGYGGSTCFTDLPPLLQATCLAMPPFDTRCLADPLASPTKRPGTAPAAHLLSSSTPRGRVGHPPAWG